MGESFGLQPDPPNLAGLLQMVREIVFGVPGQLLHGRCRPEGPSLQQLERGLDNGIHRAGHRQRDQPARLDRIFGHRGPDSARVGEIQQYRGRQHTLAPVAFQCGLGRRVVEQEQQEVLGDLRHSADCMRRPRAMPPQEW